MIRTMLLTIAVTLAFAATGCTLITDFDEPKDAGADAGGLYSIDDNLATLVDVTLQPNNTGELSLDLATPLPQAEGSDAALLAMLQDGTIALMVLNEETMTSYNLTDGQQSSAVSSPGAYNVTISPDRLVLTVTFYNEIDSTSLHADGNYLATITVIANDLFVTESFQRDIDITQL